jgi:polar amino acid transport system substrate-binding protein
MYLKPTKTFTYLAVICFILVSFLSQAANWETIQKTGKIRLATEGAYSPFNFYKNGKLTGFEVELVESIAQKLALKYDWKAGSFDSLLMGLAPNQDRYDLVAASHSITPEREKAVDFTSPHYCTQVVIVSREGGPLTMADLKAKKVGIQVGTVGVPVLLKVQGIGDVKTFPKDPDAMQALIMGRVDAWVTDKPVAVEAQTQQASAKLKIGDPIAQMKIGMAVTKGNTTLVSQINGALSALQKEGAYKKLSLKYFNEDISCQ